MAHVNLDRRVKPTVIVAESPEAFSRVAADVITRQIGIRSDSVLALPTGATPLSLYAELARRCSENLVSFAELHSFNLDEYVGLDPEHHNSYHAYMMEHFFSKVDIDMSNVQIPNGMAPNREAECARYEREIGAVGGLDLAIIGLGANAHMGFNEPGTPFDSRTHVAELASETSDANSRYFAGMQQMPRHAITMGIGTILEARRILLMAMGITKAEAVRASLEGRVTPHVPASVLQTHPHLTVVLDRDAASRLTVSPR